MRPLPDLARLAVGNPAELWDRARMRYLHPFYVDLFPDPGRSVLVAGSARSGTTWLAELITHDRTYRYLFEPFRPGRLPLARPFGTRRYLPLGTDDPSLVTPAGRILTGRVRGHWVDRLNRAMVPRRRLIKDVWANLLLPWLHDRFPRVRLILVLRHPLAATSSQLILHDWDWKVDVAGLLQQPDLVRDHLAPQEALMRRVAATGTSLERHLVTWCAENVVPLRSPAAARALVVFYEDLWQRPEREAERLSRFLDHDLGPDVAARARTPSLASSSRTRVSDGMDPLTGWMDRLSKRDIAGALEVLEAFGLDSLYGPEPLPRVEADSVLPRPRLPLGIAPASSGQGQ